VRRTLVLAVLTFAVIAAPARATDFSVNTNADPASPDNACTTTPGGCTLRDAIDDAGPADRVIVPADRYNLTQGPLGPNGENIIGAGARTTVIDGGGTGNVFLIANTTGTQISGLTLTNGGGQSQSSGSGGAILVLTNFAPAGVTVRDSTIATNRATSGGGIASNGTVTVENSTIVGNTATSGFGGGVLVSGGTTRLTNTTVSGNIAAGGEGQGGGVFVAAGALIADGVTIAANQAAIGGGLWVETPSSTSASASLTRTLIAGNTANNCGGMLPTGSPNLASDATCGFAGSPQNPLLGSLANNGGPTDTHALAAGSPAINTGGSCSTITDQRGVVREGACDIGAYEYVTPPAGPTPLPAPKVGKSVNVFPRSGTVKIKARGKKHFHTLVAGEHIPTGSTIDTRKGRVQVVAAANKKGATSSADFYDGLFKVTQSKKSKPITTLTLTEKLTGCKASGKKASATKKKVKKRRLWGDGKGRFQTKGKHSAATVVGTKWLVEDRCTSTLTRVARGRVKVRDFAKHKTVLVKKGHRYIARAK
jgi:hypothetical protein